jgi:protein-S-isoprenylcysteine O-methyltransferase Ste14
MSLYAVAILAAAWLVWVAPFSLLRRPAKPQTLDRRARWGIILQSLAYCCVWVGPFWTRPTVPWRAAVALLFFAAGDLLVWTATHALGRQWRIDAGLNADHELIRSGPYRLIRHPIYASMLAMLLGTGFLIALWAAIPLALVFFLIGIEIRVRVEDALLAARFGQQFQAFRQNTPAYIPFVR